MENKVEEQLKLLEELSSKHPEACMALIKAGNSKLYAMDLISIAVFKRSMALISGFCTMIRNRNFICAAPIIRMQLDNALRFYATTLVKKPDDLVSGFIDGTHINNYKDFLTGRKLTDSYLVEKLSQHFSGIKSVYKHTSGYIHLSDKHLFNALTKGEEYRTVSMVVGPEDSVVTDEQRLEAIAGMIDITKIVLWCLSGWTAKKDSMRN